MLICHCPTVKQSLWEREGLCREDPSRSAGGRHGNQSRSFGILGIGFYAASYNINDLTTAEKHFMNNSD